MIVPSDHATPATSVSRRSKVRAGTDDTGAKRRLRLVAPSVVAIFAILAGMTDVKVGPVQVTEVFAALFLPFLFAPLVAIAPTTRTPLSRRFVARFAVFITLATVGATTAYFSQTFAVPGDSDSLLKQPGWISASRILQMLLVFFCFLTVRTYTHSRPRLLRLGVRAYIFAAAAFSIYGIVSFFLFGSIGVDIGGAYGEEGLRVKSLFVEGGPFGVYAASAFVLAFAQRPRGMLSSRSMVTCTLLIGLALLMSQSKAGLLALAFSGIAAVVIKGELKQLRRHALSIAALLVVMIGYAVKSELPEQMVAYYATRELIIESADHFKSDPNVSMGRVAGAVITPTMIEKNPLMGIGIGNYSLLRDGSEYISGMPAVNAWDLPGLGLFSFAAEVGILGVLAFSLAFISIPVRAVRRRAPFALVICSIFPLAAFLFGTQPTFAYPWILAAMAASLIETDAPVRTHWQVAQKNESPFSTSA